MKKKRDRSALIGKNYVYTYSTIYLVFLGMLLTMMTSDHKPPANVINMWLDGLLHDDIMIRYIAFQVIYFIPY